MFETSRKVALCILCLTLSLLVSQVGCQASSSTSDTTTAASTGSPASSSSPVTSTVPATSQNVSSSAPPVTSTEATSFPTVPANTNNMTPTSNGSSVSSSSSGTSTVAAASQNPSTSAPSVTPTEAASPSTSTLSTGNITSTAPTNASSTPAAGTASSGSTANGTDGNQTTAASPATSTNAPTGQSSGTVSPPLSSTAGVTSMATGQTTAGVDTSPPSSIASTSAPWTTPLVTTPSNSLPFSSDTFKSTIIIGENQTISCTTCNSTTVKDPVYNEFKSITGFLYVSTMVQASGAHHIQVDMWFSVSQLRTVNRTQWGAQINAAILNLQNKDGLTVKTESVDAIAQAFVADINSVCSAPNICPPGFDCNPEGYCQHKCTSVSCGDHGVCSVTIDPQGKASTSCVCQSNYDYTYSGDKCQDSETGKGKVAAIVGGVLGAFCGLFLIIIIIMCCRQRGDSSASKYNLSGNANRGYSDMGMKEL